MKQAIRRLVKGVAAFGLMMIAVVAFASTAFATSGQEPPGFRPEGSAKDAAPIITKRMRVPEGLDIPAVGFTFEITPKGAEGTTDPNEAKHVVPEGDTPSLSPVTINHPVASSDSIKANVEGAFRYSDKSSNPILTNANFTRAGLYIYSVTEVIPDAANAVAGITYSRAEYKMRVYVENTSDGGLAVKLVTFHLVTDDDGVAETSEAKVDKVIFRNTYNTSTEFEISKSVAGAYADKTKMFEYNMTLQKAPGLAENERLQYTAKVYKRSFDSPSAPYDEDTGRSYNFSTDTTPTTFYLAHNEKLVFDPIAVGTKYVLTEVKNTNYKASVSVSNSGTEFGTATAPDSNDAVIGAAGTGNTYLRDELKAPIVLTQKGTNDADINKAEWTNTYVDPPTPTGIFMNNLPFILMIVIAISGFTGYIVMKRRSRRV